MAPRTDTSEYSTSKIPTRNIGHTIDEIVRYEMVRRKGFERRWYDASFFDDGFHFRFLSRSTNRIVDLSDKSNIYSPQRAIPKASRQIRGITNLLMANDPSPVVYPNKIDITEYRGNDQMYQQAIQESKRIAKHTGYWLEEEFKDQQLPDKLALMILLACKFGISWMQVWPDTVNEEIKSRVYDAFDVICRATVENVEDSPYVVKVAPVNINEIKANPDFDKDQLEQISPDNKQAASEIKEAYMNARYNKGGHIDMAASLILKEAYLKEYLNSDNMPRIRSQEDGEKILKGRKEGDPIIRQVFVAANVWLKDMYLNMDEYPFVDFRMEPGRIYQIPLIERFIPQNKSLDVLVSRAERYANAMVTGTWLKRQGEQFSINNIAGGQVIEYSGTPPTQAEIANIPPFFFNLIQYMSALIDEQGTTTSTLSKVPQGVKANAAIESLKESEYANLTMSSRRLKTTIKKIAERFLDIADHNFITQKDVYYLERGNPKYFSVIGHSALKGRKKLNAMQGIPQDIIPLNGDTRVDIEIESGLGFTREGQKGTMLQLFQELDPYVQQGLIPPEAFKVAIQKFLETYQFGATSEFMEAMDKYMGQNNMTDQQIMQMKTALLEALKEAGEVGPEADQTKIHAAAIGAAQALKDTGVIKNTQQPAAQPQKPPSVSIGFDKLPPEGQVQAAAQAGIQITPDMVENEQRKQQMAQQVLKQSSMMGRGGGQNGRQGSQG